MNIQIRAYQSKDAASAAQIWNEVVTDGNPFPRTLTKFLAFISFILIMLEDVGTSVMPAMLSVKISVDCI